MTQQYSKKQIAIFLNICMLEQIILSCEALLHTLHITFVLNY